MIILVCHHYNIEYSQLGYVHHVILIVLHVLVDHIINVKLVILLISYLVHIIMGNVGHHVQMVQQSILIITHA